MISRQARRVVDAGRRIIHAPQGLTRLPSRENSVVSDLFIWRRDNGWTTNFELLDLLSLVDPETHLPERVTKLVVFDAQGRIIADEKIHVEPAVRQTLNIQDYVPPGSGDFGTFACFHLGVDPGLLPVGTFFAERGYCGYARGSEGPRSFVHGNLDAVSWSSHGLELLGTRGFVTSRYRLQAVVEPDVRFELAVVNPSNHPVTIKIQQEGRDGKQISSFDLEPNGLRIEVVGGGRRFDSLVSLISKLPMARPLVFVSRGSTFDVFHG